MYISKIKITNTYSLLIEKPYNFEWMQIKNWKAFNDFKTARFQSLMGVESLQENEVVFNDGINVMIRHK